MNVQKAIILGIDPGTHTGWALYQYDRIVNFGTTSFAEYSDAGYGAMFAAFRKFLSDIQRDRGPLAAIAYELPFSGFGAAVTGRITTGMIAHVLERCYAWHCRPIPVNVKTLKKFATGSGNAKKPEMILAAATVLGKQLKSEIVNSQVYTLTEHEADAIHIARWAWTQLEGNGSP